MSGLRETLVKNISQDPGRGAPMAEVVLRDPYRYMLKQERWIAVEGLHTGQFVYCGATAKLAVGSVLLSAGQDAGRYGHFDGRREGR